MSIILESILSDCSTFMNNQTYQHPNILIMPHDYFYETIAELNTTTGVTTYERLKAMIGIRSERIFKLFIRADIPRLIVARGNI